MSQAPEKRQVSVLLVNNGLRTFVVNPVGVIVVPVGRLVDLLVWRLAHVFDLYEADRPGTRRGSRGRGR